MVRRRKIWCLPVEHLIALGTLETGFVEFLSFGDHFFGKVDRLVANRTLWSTSKAGHDRRYLCLHSLIEIYFMVMPRFSYAVLVLECMGGVS